MPGPMERVPFVTNFNMLTNLSLSIIIIIYIFNIWLPGPMERVPFVTNF
jgi:hypothetical protein